MQVAVRHEMRDFVVARANTQLCHKDVGLAAEAIIHHEALSWIKARGFF